MIERQARGWQTCFFCNRHISLLQNTLDMHQPQEHFQYDSIREALLALRECQKYFLQLVHVQSGLQ